MKILLAIDGSPCSHAAVAEVARRPWPDGSQFRILTVLRPWTSEWSRSGVPAACAELNTAMRDEAMQHVQEATTVLQSGTPARVVTSLLRQGSPKDIILEEAESWSADLIVVGSHGYGAIRRFLLGSVSLAVAAAASCSVEIVRPPIRTGKERP